MTTEHKVLGADFGDIFPGFSPKPSERKKRGEYLLIGGRNLKNGEFPLARDLGPPAFFPSNPLRNQ